MTVVEQQPEIATAATPEPAQGIGDYLRRPLQILGAYRRQDLAPDLVAGLTVAAVAIPQSIAYASIAELPPQTGLYAAAVAAVVGSLWGSSRFLATGPVNAVSRGRGSLRAVALTPTGDGDHLSLPVAADGTFVLDVPFGVPFRLTPEDEA